MSPSADGGGRAPLFSEKARAERRARAAKVGAPYLVPILLVAVVGTLLWTRRRELAALDLPIAAASPPTQVKEALAHQPRASIADVYGFHSGGTAELAPVRFGDVAVEVDGKRARVLAMVEADGAVTWRDERAALSYLGREAFHMAPCRIALWCADGEQFANLRAVLLVLFRRADAAAAGDGAALARLVAERYAGPEGRPALLARLSAGRPAPEAHIRAWQIRVERERAEVGEDADVTVDGRTERRRARYTLVRDGERWRFSDGL